MVEVIDKKVIKCPDCTTEIKLTHGIYICHKCKEAWQNRGYGFGMYERLGKQVYINIVIFERLDSLEQKIKELEVR